MHWLAASHPGGLTDRPYARHMGDVRSATRDSPGTEIIEVDSTISHKLSGPVGMVFSVYSAISNGPVSIASLKPVMTVEYRGNLVRCDYSFPDGKVAEKIYTYVIGTILIDKDDLDVRLSGLTSAPGSENTPWIERRGADLVVTVDGPPIFKKGRTMLARLIGAGTRKYANV
jgi:tellurite resistance protein TerA